MKVFFKFFSFIFFVFFTYAVCVQWNDPDAVIWYVIYGIAALASIIFFFNKLPFWAGITLFVIYFLGVFIDWPSQFQGVKIGEGDIKNIEEGRESLGLLIAAIVMLVYAVRTRIKK
tara:strand:+ start:15458 stop:15805 length:348 start_codon:yes stop_codon:yes gene_type:complete